MKHAVVAVFSALLLGAFTLGILAVDAPTAQAAGGGYEDMVERDYFSHDTESRNEDACERVRRYGYRWSACGENIGYDATPKRVFDAWMGSPGHRANTLSGRFREVGVGAHTGDYKTTMYTVDFGARG